MKSQDVSTGNDLRFHLNVKYPDKNISSKQHSDTLSSFKTAFLSLLGEDNVLDNSDSPSGLVGFPGGASGKEPVCQCRRCKRLGFESCVGNIPWRRSWLLTPVLPGEYHGQRSLGLQRVGCDWSDLAHVHRLIKKLLSWVLLLSCVRFFATHGLQHARLPCPLPTPGVCSDSCPLSRWCHPTISSSVVPFSSRLQSSQHQERSF